MPERSSPKAFPVSLGGGSDPLRNLLLEAYDSILASRSAIYCSAPITSGQRYIEWLTQSGGSRNLIDDYSPSEREQHRVRVIEPNRAHARGIADDLRRRTRKPVIDPTAIGPVSGWRQTDWIGFWEEVIARFAVELVFVEGWEYSYGCTHEFWFATSEGIPTFDETGQPLPASRGAHQIDAVLPRLKKAGIDATKFERILGLLRGVTP